MSASRHEHAMRGANGAGGPTARRVRFARGGSLSAVGRVPGRFVPSVLRPRAPIAALASRSPAGFATSGGFLAGRGDESARWPSIPRGKNAPPRPPRLPSSPTARASRPYSLRTRPRERPRESRIRGSSRPFAVARRRRRRLIDAHEARRERRALRLDAGVSSECGWLGDTFRSSSATRTRRSARRRRPAAFPERRMRLRRRLRGRRAASEGAAPSTRLARRAASSCSLVAALRRSSSRRRCTPRGGAARRRASAVGAAGAPRARANARAEEVRSTFSPPASASFSAGALAPAPGLAWGRAR